MKESSGCVTTINLSILVFWQKTLSSQCINVKLGQRGKTLFSRQSACSVSQQALKMYLLDSNVEQVGSQDNKVLEEAAM